MCRAALFVAVVAAVALPASPAFGHAAFVGSSPEPGTRLRDAPARLALSFTEPLNRKLSTASVVALAGGRPVGAKVSAPSGRQLVLRVAKPLGTGAYRVNWHTVSTQDGHALEGSYSFGVRAAAAGAEHAVQQSPLARDGWLRVLLRGLLYASVLVFVAALVLPLLVPGSGRLWPVPERSALDVERARRRVGRVTADLAALTVAAAVGATVAEAADAAGGLAPTRLADFLLANEAGVGRVLVVVLLMAAALTYRRWRRLAATLAVLALGALAASGHASAVDPRVPSILNDWLHLVAVSVWLGGIALLVLTWSPTLRRGSRDERMAVAREVLPPFGRVALPAFVAVVLTGLVSLLAELGHFSALWNTSYGRVLAVKMLLVGVIAALSALHVYRLRPRLLAANPHPPERDEQRHWRLVRAEPLVGAGVIAAVALLVAFPLPPRQLGETGDEAQAAVAACEPCPLPRPAAAELPVAEAAGSQLVAAWVRRRRAAVSGTVRVLDYRGRPSPRPFTVAGATQTRCGQGCARFELPAAADVLNVDVRERGRSYRARLPTRWQAGGNAAARRVVRRAQAVMRDLRSFRETERVTSGPGSFAETTYQLKAPDRYAYLTNGGVRSVVIGRRQWTRPPGVEWQRNEFGGGLAFRTRSWFRWTTYARAARLLNLGAVEGRRVAQVALFDEGTPVWLRLDVDLRSGRVLGQRLIAKGHFMTNRYDRLNEPVRIDAPTGR